MKFHLRQAVAGDTPTIRYMVRQARLNPLGLDWRRFIVAVTSQEGIVGIGQVKIHRDGSRELASIVVGDEWRGQGIAKAIIDQLISIHPHPIYLTCRSSFADFYDQFGFRKIEREEMPDHFKRLSSLFYLLAKIHKGKDGLLIMKFDQG